MTEQPVETEQQFLGNEESQTVTISMVVEQPMTLTVPDAGVPLQHHVPKAHLLRRPSWAPVDDVELASLARKCAHANRLLAIAKAESARAEDALHLALGVEDQAATEVREAEEALIACTRKGTGLESAQLTGDDYAYAAEDNQ